jgi:hypothetical protein
MFWNAPSGDVMTVNELLESLAVMTKEEKAALVARIRKLTGAGSRQESLAASPDRHEGRG